MMIDRNEENIDLLIEFIVAINSEFFTLETMSELNLRPYNKTNSFRSNYLESRVDQDYKKLNYFSTDQQERSLLERGSRTEKVDPVGQA